MDLQTQVAMILQTVNIVRSVTRNVDKHYILSKELDSVDFDTFDRQTAIVYDHPTVEDLVHVDTPDGPTPAMHRKGWCVGVERGRAGGLVVFQYDEIVDKSSGHIYQREADFAEVDEAELLRFVSADDFAKAAADIVHGRMARLRQSADELNGKWLVLRHVQEGRVKEQYLKEAEHVIGGVKA